MRRGRIVVDVGHRLPDVLNHPSSDRIIGFSFGLPDACIPELLHLAVPKGLFDALLKRKFLPTGPFGTDARRLADLAQLLDGVLQLVGFDSDYVESDHLFQTAVVARGRRDRRPIRDVPLVHPVGGGDQRLEALLAFTAGVGFECGVGVRSL